MFGSGFELPAVNLMKWKWPPTDFPLWQRKFAKSIFCTGFQIIKILSNSRTNTFQKQSGLYKLRINVFIVISKLTQNNFKMTQNVQKQTQTVQK